MVLCGEEKVTLLLNTDFTSLNTFKFYNRVFVYKQLALSIAIDINVKTKFKNHFSASFDLPYTIQVSLFMYTLLFLKLKITCAALEVYKKFDTRNNHQ